MKRIYVAVAVALFLGAAGFAGAYAHSRYEASVPHGELAAAGVSIAGHRLADGESPRAFSEALARAMLDRPIALSYQGDVILEATPRELGATVDARWATSEALRVARLGDFYDRFMASRAARSGAFDVPLPVHVPADEIAARLSSEKEDLDEAPVAARRHMDSGIIEPHVTGSYIDAYRAADALEGAMQKGSSTAELDPFLIVPSATVEAARKVDVSVLVASFETKFGGPPGRDQNIRTASSRLDGVVLLPGDELSFNALVGARSVENGFAMAPEIYKGEIREGVGGGACQVASTLHAAAFFGGLEVLQRQNHSRPSAYIRPGLDATVSFPVLDLRIKNPFDFPVLVHVNADKGTLRFEILGHDRPVNVELATETAGIFRYKRKIEKTAGIKDVVVKQRGKNGMSIRRTKTVRQKSGEVSVLTSVDTYPATQEILAIPPDYDVTTLPPLPSDSPSGVAAPNG